MTDKLEMKASGCESQPGDSIVFMIYANHPKIVLLLLPYGSQLRASQSIVHNRFMGAGR